MLALAGKRCTVLTGSIAALPVLFAYGISNGKLTSSMDQGSNDNNEFFVVL